MLRAVERWGLLPPYDPSVTEAQWEGYYKERAALEWHTEAYMVGVQGRGESSPRGAGAGPGSVRPRMLREVSIGWLALQGGRELGDVKGACLSLAESCGDL